jgi:stearoyl-CoA desaturase (delta-9 desaturase)
MNDQDRACLDGILQLSHALRTVHEYRRSLQDLWSRTTASHEKLLLALQDWCNQAEASGIKALQEFAAYLRSYTLQHA